MGKRRKREPGGGGGIYFLVNRDQGSGVRDQKCPFPLTVSIVRWWTAIFRKPLRRGRQIIRQWRIRSLRPDNGREFLAS
jgi:hypothetical protein